MGEINKSKLKVILVFSLILLAILINGAYAEDTAVNETEVALDDANEIITFNESDTVQAQGEDNFNSIQNLIDNADSGASIYLENKTYWGNGSSISINKDISIYGVESFTVLDANRSSGIFYISKDAKVNICGLTFINGYLPEGDGSAIHNRGTLSISNSTIKNCYADCGALHNHFNAQLTVTNCLFDNNAAGVGAAIDDNEGFSTIIDSTFTNNACLEGGAIYKRYGSFSIYNSTFINNSAARGGGVYNNLGILYVYNSRFYSNNASDLGGGIKSRGHCEVYDSIIENNTGVCGGGIYLSEFELNVENSWIGYNDAYHGGGIYMEAKSELTVKNTAIYNNSATRGGGIDLNQGSLFLTDSVIANNTASILGGGIFCSFLNSEIENSIIANNTAASNGGGIYIKAISLKVSNVVLTNNSAANGGAFYNTGSLTLNNISANSNKATGDGGAIYNKNAISLTNSDLLFNNAENGGAVYNDGTIDLDYVNLNSNIVTGQGGAINNKRQMSLKNSIVNGNYAPIYGGAIYSLADLMIDNSTFRFNEARFGGVIYSGGLLNIANSLFNKNKAHQASSIYSKNVLSIDNSHFIGNHVTHNSGVLMLVNNDVNITNSLFKSNTGADEGGCIFNRAANVYINGTQFISNEAISYGAAIDNSGEILIENSLFDDNEANGAGAIDNGGNLTIYNSSFTSNKANVDGGAIDNRGNLTVIGSVFENNVAGGNGGAIIANRFMTVISNSIIYNNHDSNGYAIFNNTWGEISLQNNWWGSNSPDFEKLININVSDDFTWIIMKFENVTSLMQGKAANVTVSFNEVMDKNNQVFELEYPELLPSFEVTLSNGDKFSTENGIALKSISIPKTAGVISSNAHNQSISLDVALNQDYIIRITDNKNIIEDYKGNTVFKVRVIGDDGKPVGKNVAVTMNIAGKSYTAKTDGNGYASKTFSLLPGIYSISTTYKGFTAKNKIYVKKVLKASSASKKRAKSIKYTASLKYSNGKAIVGKVVTFKIGGKAYSAKTNSKGIAAVYFKNLKTYKYTVVVKYINCQVKTTLNVK